MHPFILQNQERVTGVLSGFDRLVLRGTLRPLSYTAGMMNFLYGIGVLLKDFGSYAERTTKRLREGCGEAARRLGRADVYLRSSRISKEAVAKQIMKKEAITDGLICLLRCVEPCMSYEIVRDRKSKRLFLQPRERKCLHLYRYWIDPVFGFMSARLQSWFPFNVQICVNGREWLSRRMDAVGMGYKRDENCFLWLEDVPAAQRLMDEQLRFQWPAELDLIARRLNPTHEEIFRQYELDYYWTVHQSEWATDIMFRSAGGLSRIYPQLVRQAMSSFSSGDVMRFLGRKVNGNFAGEVIGDFKRRPEGIRVKHRVGANSVKMYDKRGRVLRVETTVNDPKDFKVFRPLEGDPLGKPKWRPMRKGIADLHRRAEVSEASNKRYLDALASANTDSPMNRLIDPVCRPVMWNGRKMRALRPWSEEDRLLIQTVSRGEFTVGGFRNRDLLPHLSPGRFFSPQDRRRASARVTRQLRLLRAHHIIRRVAKTHRYVFTKKGRLIATAILEYQNVTLEQLNGVAA